MLFPRQDLRESTDNCFADSTFISLYVCRGVCKTQQRSSTRNKTPPRTNQGVGLSIFRTHTLPLFGIRKGDKHSDNDIGMAMRREHLAQQHKSQSRWLSVGSDWLAMFQFNNWRLLIE